MQLLLSLYQRRITSKIESDEMNTISGQTKPQSTTSKVNRQQFRRVEHVNGPKGDDRIDKSVCDVKTSGTRLRGRPKECERKK